MSLRSVNLISIRIYFDAACREGFIDVFFIIDPTEANFEYLISICCQKKLGNGLIPYTSSVEFDSIGEYHTPTKCLEHTNE